MRIWCLATAVLAGPTVEQVTIGGVTYESHINRDRELNHVDNVPTYWERKAYCDNLGGGYQLPAPTNAQENQAIQQLLIAGDVIYLGFSRQTEENGEVHDDWFNLYTGEALGYNNWRSDIGDDNFAMMFR